MKVPAFVSEVRVAVLRLRRMPVPTVLSVPPVMDAPVVNCTSEPVRALMVPPVFVKAPPPLPVKRRMPPPLARMTPRLINPSMVRGSMTNARPTVPLKTLASIRPPLRLTIASSLVPMLPELLVSP